MIRLDRYEKPPVEVDDERFLFAVIRAAFNQRRKTLANSLGNAGELGISRERAAAVLEKLGFDPSVRGEALTLEQFARLCNCLSREIAGFS